MMAPRSKGLSIASKEEIITKDINLCYYYLTIWKKTQFHFGNGNVIFLHNKKDFPDFVSEKSFLKSWLYFSSPQLDWYAFGRFCLRSPQKGNISKKKRRTYAMQGRSTR